MKKQRTLKQMRSWGLASVALASGVAAGLASMSMAMGSVPGAGQVTDDTAISQKLSEIRVPKHAPLNFDEDIQSLSNIEPRYRERLTTIDRVKSPMQRIAARKYRASSARSGRAQAKRN